MINNNTKLLAECCVGIDDYLYFVCTDLPLVYRMSLTTSIIELVGMIPGEDTFLELSCRKIIHYNNKLVFVPYRMRKIHILNLDNNMWKEIELGRFGVNKNKYIEGFVYKNSVYMIGGDAPYIIALNMDNDRVSMVDDTFKKYKDSNLLFCRSGCVVRDSCVYIAMAVTNNVLRLNLKTMESEELQIKSNNASFSGIAYDGNKFWLSPRKGGDVIIWDEESFSKSFKLPYTLKPETLNFLGAHYSNNYIILPGFDDDKTIIIDVRNQLAEVISEQFNFFTVLSDLEIAVGQELNGESEIVVFDGKKEKRYKSEINGFSTELIKKSFHEHMNFGNSIIIKESKNIGLSFLMEAIK